MAADLLLVVAAIIGLGVVFQLLAARFRVPSVLFLVTAGIALGPEGLGVVTLESFGTDALSTIVGVSVAIIVFEGAFHRKVEKLREAPTAVLRLVTIGAAIAFVVARQIAEKLDVIPMRVLVVGGGRVGRSLAERLEARGENVVVVERNPAALERARNDGFTAREGDGTDTDALRAAGADDARIVVAATGDDDANLLVARLASSTFDVETVVARANDPDNVDAFEDPGVRTISAAESTAWAIDNVIERPALSKWMTELGRSGDVQEVEVTDDGVAGRSISEVGSELPDGVVIALVSRDGTNEVPGPGVELRRGDHVTFIGRTEAVREAIERFGTPA